MNVLEPIRNCPGDAKLDTWVIDRILQMHFLLRCVVLEE